MFSWNNEAWDEYLSWQREDKKTLKRINKLIKSIQRDGYSKGLGKPEPLKGELQGLWSMTLIVLLISLRIRVILQFYNVRPITSD
jgi:Txe/YoeB family toxin of toxin-antitoxin system